MAKGEHEKVNRPSQTGYNISLDPQSYGEKVTWVTVRFGTKQSEDIYQWDISVGPIAFKSKTKKTVLAVNDDQLPAIAGSCYYQMLCEIEQDPPESSDPSELSPPHEPETLITEPTLLTAVNMNP